MRTLGIITARGGSKRLPHKNRKFLAGKPLVAWVLSAAIKSQRLSHVVVSSDDEEILRIAKDIAPNSPLRRPPELSTDEAPSIGAVHHALAELESAGMQRFDTVAVLQPTSPFTLPGDIDDAIDLLEQSGADSVVTVMQVRQLHPAKFKVFADGSRLLPYFEDDRGRMAYQNLTTTYTRNGSLYASRRDVIERGLIIGDDCRGSIMPRERSVDIDDAFDWSFAEFLASRMQDEQPPSASGSAEKRS